jgi:hypothetical protein
MVPKHKQRIAASFHNLETTPELVNEYSKQVKDDQKLVTDACLDLLRADGHKLAARFRRGSLGNLFLAYPWFLTPTKGV